MSRFNTYMNNGFSGCRLLAYARDTCRNRDVRIYMVPGYTEEVGVTDGVDSWIAPVIANPFSVNILRIMRDINEGKSVAKPIPPGIKKTRVTIQIEPAPRSRRVLLA